MNATPEPYNSLPMSVLLGRTARALGDLVERHVELAKVELKRDTAGLGGDLALAGASAVFLASSWVFVNLALALAMAFAFGAVGAFGALAALYAALGVAAGLAARKRLSRRHLLDDTRHQLKLSATRIASQLREDPRTQWSRHDGQDQVD